MGAKRSNKVASWGRGKTSPANKMARRAWSVSASSPPRSIIKMSADGTEYQMVTPALAMSLTICVGA